MNWRKALCALSIAIYGSACVAQDITDVEAKPYGSYTGGAIDTVDLATGNLMLNIPLISFPQLGALPPLSFSVELNNAPYTQSTLVCDPDIGDCAFVTSRYDTSPPGTVYDYLATSTELQTATMSYSCPGGTCTVNEYWGYEDGSTQDMGAYLTSSFEGGIVTGQDYLQSNGEPGEIDYSVVDPSGTTHELESDNSNWNIYRAPDGSGYTFIPSGTAASTPSGALIGYDPWSGGNGLWTLNVSQPQFWLENASDYGSDSTSGVRLGTLYSPTGIQYTSTVQTFPQVNSDNSYYANWTSPENPYYTPQALISTEMDPSGNEITRGPWYWSGYYSYPNTPFSDIDTIYSEDAPLFLPHTIGPYYKDSVGRIIPDIISMQATQYTWNWTHSGEPTLTWTVPGPENNPITYQITYILISNTQSWQPLSNEPNPFPDPTTDLAVQGYAIESILLPNNTEWEFTYNGADLSSVTTPSGGTITYKYTTIPYASPIMNTRCNAVCHAVSQRTETDGHGNQWTTSYSYGVPSSLQNCPTVYAGGVNVLYAFTTTETDPSGNDTVHSFCALPNSAGGVSLANQYHEILTQYYQGHAAWNNPPLKTVQTSFEYQNDIPHMVSSSAPGGVGVINFLPNNIATTTPATTTTDVTQYSNDSGQNNTPMPLFTAARIFCTVSDGGTLGCNSTLDSAYNPITIPISYLSPTTEINEDAHGNPLRTTSTTFEFQNPATGYMNANLIALPLSETVSGSSGGVATVSGTTSYKYDESAYSPSGVLGNQTSKTETYSLSGSISPGGTSITTHTAYNSQGMPTSKIDGSGNATAITYDGTGLFPNKIQRPTTNGTQHIDYYSYDSDTGNLNWHTDENSRTTNYGYDAMGRVTSIGYPDGGGSTICYTDAGGSCPETSSPVSFSLYTSTTTGSTNITTGHSYDGWGRQYRSSVLSDPLGPTIVDTTYDWEGKVTSVSNPYRSTPAPNDPPSGTTSYTYDALGRKTIQHQPDGSEQQWCYDGTATNGQSNCAAIAEGLGGSASASAWTDVSDETGRHTQQQFDALGHLVAAIEPDPASGHLALVTDYAYDVFGDLFTVNQLGASGNTPVQQRVFYYDIPSRVTMACNPEALGAGQNCNQSSAGTWYTYDADSNLTSKKDNRGITTNYTYDALNRLLSKTYSGDPNGTASSCYLYDGATAQNLSGRLAAQWTQKTACQGNPPALPSSGILTETAISAYDAMGRLLSEQRCMGVANCASGGYAMSYTYDLAGKLLTYPSGFGNLNFTNGYDAAGHLSSVTQGSDSPLFWAPSYTPAGALSGAQLGASIGMGRTFDSRQRVTGETDSTPTQ